MAFKKKVFMKKFTWFLLSCLMAASAFFTWNYWDKVFPIVNLSITMDRSAAISKALDVANQHKFDTQDYSQAVQFKEDGMLQAFVELEGGGKQAFLDMMNKGYHQPFQWVVRFYQHGKIPEFFVNFTPEGKLYGLKIKLAETQKGASLSKDEALKIALKFLQDFEVDISNYSLVEHNMTAQPSGRVDHSFVYERNDISLEKGRYRLELKVFGDKFSGLERTIKIPDEFTRRYQEMFSDNKLIASVAQNIAILVYLFIFALFLGLFFFQDIRFMQLKKHACIGIIFWSVMFLVMINKWPFLWNYYSTEYSPILFAFNQIAMMAFVSILFSVFVYILMILVDAADRYSFGWHIQFLKSWSSTALVSVQIFELTALAYAGAVIFVGYEVLYNLWTLSMGWWSPLGRLVDPNILSTYIPFLSPIGSAFQAGFWEEIACRGLPLAGITFLTRNSRHKKWWFLLMFVVQALIFGALHANYPQQPAYNRLIELLVPSFVFGAMYYFFGLLPGIIMHYVYDAFLMCIPIWVSGLIVQKILALIFILIPLLLVVGAWIKNKGKLKEAPENLYNKIERYQEPKKENENNQRALGCQLKRKHAIIFSVLSFVIIFSSYFYVSYEFIANRCDISKEQALMLATNTIKDYELNLEDGFISYVNFVDKSKTSQNKFIWQNYGKVAYKNLQQDYMPAHVWNVGWKKFTGSVEDRAELFGVTISPQSEVLEITHTIPESWSGADLSDSEAQKLALNFIKKIYGLDKNSLELVSCESKKHENRRDFTVIFKDIKRYPFKESFGQARIVVNLAGNELQHIERLIHVPEDWNRAENSRVLQDFILNAILYAIASIIVVFALYISIRKNKLSLKMLKPIFILSFGYVFIRIFNLVNGWDQVLMWLPTAEPWINQMISMISSYFIYYLLIGFLYAVVLSLFIKNGAGSICKQYNPWLMGLILIGAALQCIKLWIMQISVQMEPIDYISSYINFKWPALGMIIGYFLYKVLLTATFYMSFSVVSQKLSKFLKILFFILVGIVISDVSSFSNILVWIVGGIIFGLILYFLNEFIIKEDIESVFLISLGLSLMELVPTVLYLAYPGVLTQVAGSGIIFGLFILYIYKKV